MDDIGIYLRHVILAALICAIVAKLIHKGVIGSMVQLLCGIFLSLALLMPFVRIRFDDLQFMTGTIRSDAEAAVSAGENSFRENIGKVISQRTTAYILDKAGSLGLTLDVSVHLTEDTVPIPCGVTLQGSASPYAKQTLNGYISRELGIDLEEIKWMP